MHLTQGAAAVTQQIAARVRDEGVAYARVNNLAVDDLRAHLTALCRDTPDPVPDLTWWRTTGLLWYLQLGRALQPSPRLLLDDAHCSISTADWSYDTLKHPPSEHTYRCVHGPYLRPCPAVF